LAVEEGGVVQAEDRLDCSKEETCVYEYFWEQGLLEDRHRGVALLVELIVVEEHYAEMFVEER
jgi:hypothetical protein